MNFFEIPVTDEQLNESITFNNLQLRADIEKYLNATDVRIKTIDTVQRGCTLVYYLEIDLEMYRYDNYKEREEDYKKAKEILS